MHTQVILISNLTNPETGKTYYQENLEKTHNIPIGTLVEITENGLRLYVVAHERDCDGTPLYALSFDKEWKADMFGKLLPEIYARFSLSAGWPEEVLKPIELNPENFNKTTS